MIRYAGFAAMAVTWGLTWLAAKAATAAAPVMLVAGIRLVIAAAFFLLWSTVAGYSLRVGAWGRVTAASLLINTICYGFLFWGVVRTPTGLAAIVNLALIPVFSMLIGAVYGEERITGRRLAAVGLGTIGLVLLFSSQISGDASGREVVLGLGAVVVGTAAYAWGAVVSKPLVRVMQPVALAFWQTLIGGTALLVLSLAFERPGAGDLAALTHGPALAGLAFLVMFGSMVGFSVYLWLLREWGAFRAGLYAFLSPVIAVAVGVLWIGETFVMREGLGMLVLFGAAGLVIGREPVDAAT